MRLGPSPKLTGANNIAVPPTKTWTVNPSRKDDPAPLSAREERQHPPHLKPSTRRDTARDGSEDLRLDAPVRLHLFVLFASLMLRSASHG